jgi:RNA polymerase sigma-70 factor (family 1)
MSSLAGHTDSELVALLKAGEESAFTEIFERYWDKLLAVAVNRLGEEQEAEECVQDVFVRFWQRREELVLTHKLSTYLWAAAKYQVLNRLDKRYAKRKLKTTELRDDNVIGLHSPEVYLLEKELMARIEATVQELPEKCRMVYRLSREEGKTNPEIAAELDIAEKTVEGHLTRALRDIRTNLTSIAPAFLVTQLLEEIHRKC